MVGLAIVVIIVSVAVIATLFITTSPEFGGKASQEQKQKYAKSSHYKEGKFFNETTTIMSMNFKSLVKQIWNASSERTPKRNIDVEKIDSLDIVNHNAEVTKLTWFGHSTFLLELDGKNILLDPMFGKVCAPHPWLGTNRYSSELPIEVEKLPFIDAVIFSHDHYDHLDYGSIQKLKHKVGEFYTPLGVGNHLNSWGIKEEKIHELDWWDKTTLDEIELVCTPARHFSGRGVSDRFNTFWSSWVIKGKKDNIYFSGDGGYGPHFKEIGEQYGPFDISLMECGQYNKDWPEIHMMPEETAQAAVDLNSKLFMPIHWGAFTLAFHTWTDPVERVTQKAHELNIPVTTPKIGEAIIVGSEVFPEENWWSNY